MNKNEDFEEFSEYHSEFVRLVAGMSVGDTLEFGWHPYWNSRSPSIVLWNNFAKKGARYSVRNSRNGFSVTRKA